jgi:flagellar biosynthetic protein FlhB
MPEDKGSKTEQPTDKKMREAVEEGNFAKTPDIQVVFVLLAAVSVVSFYGKEQAIRVGEIAIGIFGGLARYPINVEAVGDWTLVSATTMLGFVLPMCVTCAAAGVLAGGIQSRFQLSPKVLDFKLSRLDPTQGFKRIFSGQASVKLATDAAKVSIIGAILWQALKGILSDPLFYTPVAPNRLGTFIGQSFATLMWRCIISLGGIAALNYLYQQKRVLSELKMTRQEVVDENRQTEGDPRMRGIRRQMARRMLQKQMLKAVPTADVVITNPTHFAIALKYQRGVDRAPIVLAKGERLFAKRIKEIAAEHDVPMVENKPVARMLFKYGKVGKPIPSELYKAVAEILAFVYKTHRYYFHQLRARRDAL